MQEDPHVQQWVQHMAPVKAIVGEQDAQEEAEGPGLAQTGEE